MDDLFRRANKYSMLEDNVRAATQHVLVTNRPVKNDSATNPNVTDQQKQTGRGQAGPRQADQPRFTPSMFHMKISSP